MPARTSTSDAASNSNDLKRWEGEGDRKRGEGGRSLMGMIRTEIRKEREGEQTGREKEREGEQYHEKQEPLPNSL